MNEQEIFKMKEQQFRAIIEALTKNNLQKLDLSNNQIRNSGAIALAGVLNKNITLQTLYLQDNRIGDKGAIALAKALEVNTTLQTLDLSWNEIGDTGAIALIVAINVKKTLVYLNLSSNPITEKSKILKKDETIILTSADFFKLLNQLKQKYNKLDDINKKENDIIINLEDKTLKIGYKGEYKFEGDCPYFKFGTKYYTYSNSLISLRNHIYIFKKEDLTNDSLPNNEDIDYLEYIIKKHFNKVNLNNNLNEMKQINYKK